MRTGRLGFGGGWRWVEVDFGGLAGAWFGFEVGVVAGEAAKAGDEAVGEEGDVGVVVLDGFVVAAALDGDAVFGAGEFVLETHEIFVGFELGIIFGEDKDFGERGFELI